MGAGLSNVAGSRSLGDVVPKAVRIFSKVFTLKVGIDLKLEKIDENWVLLCLFDIVLIECWLMFDRNPQDNLIVIRFRWPISPNTITFGVLRGNVTTALHKGTQLPVACDGLKIWGWKPWWSHLSYKCLQTLINCMSSKVLAFWKTCSDVTLLKTWSQPTRDDMDEPVWLDLYKCSCQSLAAPTCKEMLKLVKWVI